MESVSNKSCNNFIMKYDPELIDRIRESELVQ